MRTSLIEECCRDRLWLIREERSERGAVASRLETVFERIDTSITPTAQDYGRFRSQANETTRLLLRSGIVEECRLVGSISRSTAIRQTSDVDLLAVMTVDRETSTQRPSELISRLAHVLRDSGADVTSGTVAVPLRFEDRPTVDIIPATKLKGSDVYLIPSERGDAWQQFEPNILQNLVANCGRRLGPRFRVLVRLIKYWNKSRNAGLRSSDLEELVCIAMGDATEISSYPDAIAHVLAFVSDWIEGDRYARNKMGGPFLPDKFNSRAGDIAKESSRAVQAMNQSQPDAQADATTLKEFFGGELAEDIY